jgi:hypothetical protein
MAKRVHKHGSRRISKKDAPRTPDGGPDAKKPAARRVSHARPAQADPLPHRPAAGTSPQRIQVVREVFWQNVMREILTSLMMLSMRLSAKAGAHAGEDGAQSLDGRLGIMTAQGQRIPIARVFPVFSATVGQSPTTITLSTLLECTVFQVHTPAGEVFTLPIQDIRGFHSLTEELMKQLEESAREGADGATSEPFGFAAFTSLARSKLLPEPDDEEGPQGAD